MFEDTITGKVTGNNGSLSGTQEKQTVIIDAQTSAIRIDDNAVSKRKTWSSEKLNEIASKCGKIQFGTVEEWSRKGTYIPEKGELIIYSDYSEVEGVVYPAIKVGDGKAYLVDLPFFSGTASQEISERLEEHINDDTRHITEESRNKWDSKLNYTIDGNNLIFNTQ